jgi:hypothetical protein
MASVSGKDKNMSTHIIESPADLLDAAAEEIEEHGWCVGTVFDDNGNLCVLGSMRIALYGSPWVQLIGAAEQRCLISATNMFSNEFDMPAACWNDNVCSDKADAVDTLRQLAKRYRETHS